MPLNSKIQVPLPEKGIIVRSNLPYPSVYKVLSTFRNEKGQPTNTSQLIGKLDPETGMLIPNDNWQPPKTYDNYGIKHLIFIGRENR
jgi:hypothetical protein